MDRAWAAYALGRSRWPRAVPSLVAALADTDGLVVQCAVTSLGTLGRLAEDALPALERLARERPGVAAHEVKEARAAIRSRADRR